MKRLSRQTIQALIESVEDDGEAQAIRELIPDNAETYAALAAIGYGEHYESNQWKTLVDTYTPGGWSQFWPVIDGNGILTGEIVDSQDGYYNIADEAMIAAEDLPPSILAEIRRREATGTFDGYAWLEEG